VLLHYGSSNLSRAGFSDNCEANMTAAIKRFEYQRICKWLEDAADPSTPGDGGLDQASLSRGSCASGRTAPTAVVHVKLRLPHGEACEDEVRAAAVKRPPSRKSAKGSRRRRTMLTWQYQRRRNSGRVFGTLGNHRSRFQGSGLQFTGKGARWREACGALARILKAARSVSGSNWITLSAARLTP